MIAIVIGIAFLLLVCYSLYQAHKSADKFNLIDLLMHEGKTDKMACVFMGSWAVHSWVMVSLTISEKMSEGYVTLYSAAWIAPIVAKIIKGKQ